MSAPDQHDGLPRVPRRDASGHKGTFGTVVVVGGCCHRVAGDDAPALPTMIGGACFSALAALRTGCGLAKIVAPEPVIGAALTIAPSATGFGVPVDVATGDMLPHQAAAAIDAALVGARAVVIGPGLGVSPGAIAAVLRVVAQADVPVVVDADAINCLAQVPEFWVDLRAPMVVTPHIGEFARLAKSVGMDAGGDSATDRRAGAEAMAQRLGAVVVLKSAVTVVTDGHATWEQDRPNPVLATAGTGDVLTGIIAGLMAQHVRPHIAMGSFTKASQHLGGLSILDAARLGVAIHADAAALWRAASGTSGGMVAMELLELVPRAVESRTG